MTEKQQQTILAIMYVAAFFLCPVLLFVIAATCGGLIEPFVKVGK